MFADTSFEEMHVAGWRGPKVRLVANIFPITATSPRAAPPSWHFNAAFKLPDTNQIQILTITGFISILNECQLWAHIWSKYMSYISNTNAFRKHSSIWWYRYVKDFCHIFVIVIDYFLISDLNAWQRLPDWRSEYRAKTSVADYNVTCDKSFCN